MGKLDGKVAVVTGAASGLGRASALRFAKEGAAVVAADLNSQGGELIVAEIAAAGGRGVYQRSDVTSESDVKALIERAVREYGRLDITYNNAGVIGAMGSIDSTTEADWDKTFAILTKAVFFGIKHSVAPMRKAGGGSIISTASIAGMSGSFRLHAYSAAKAAVINLTRTAALELGKDKIRVNCICPGIISTPLVHGGIPGGKETVDPLIGKAQAIQRAGQAEDIANMALFLASDEASWVTGAAMVVDGGFTAGQPFMLAPGGLDQLGAAGYSGPSFQRG
ncbi:MAG TPA: SDR family NAD(P)-dependent oxidoreductase [Candidatus Binataceae bacterium]|nr:SDR family NAD(P)-dependent oxidoreductase [Candidatus Binataceae bacterium]